MPILCFVLSTPYSHQKVCLCSSFSCARFFNTFKCWQQVHTVRASDYERLVTPQRSYSGGHGHTIAPHTPASPEPPEIPPGFAMIAPNLLLPISALQSSYSPAPKPQQPPAYANALPRMQV